MHEGAFVCLIPITICFSLIKGGLGGGFVGSDRAKGLLEHLLF